MHASTTRACLRRLWDWVNSVSKHHAAFLSIMFSHRVSPGFRRLVPVFYGSGLANHPRICLTSTGMVPQITHEIGTTSVGFLGVLPALATPTCRWPLL